MLGRCEPYQGGAGALRALKNAHRDLGQHAKEAFRPGHNTEKIVAACIEVLAAQADDLAIDQDQLATERLFVVTPYFRQCTPPEFSATLPPMVQAIWDDGSGANRSRHARPLASPQGWSPPAPPRHPICKIDLADAVELGHSEQDSVR